MDYPRFATEIGFLFYPGTSNYTDAIAYNTRAEMEADIESRVMLRLTSQSYTRLTANRIRVEIPIKQMRRYNYMYVRNYNHEDATYYCFIENAEYVNERTVEITFVVDPLMTFYFDTVGREQTCFVERQHAESDEVGGNLVPEPVQPGELVPERKKKLFDGGGMIAVLIGQQNPRSTYSEYTARVYDGVPTGGTLRLFRADDIYGLQQFLALSRDDTDKNTLVNSILGVYTLPAALLTTISPPSGGVNLASGSHVTPYTTEGVTKPKKGDMFGGYTPKNNKLYTYPFCYLAVSNNNGSAMSIRYEFCTDEAVTFKIYGTFNRPVQLQLRPVNYGGISKDGDPEISPIDSLALSGYPQGAWVSGGYDAWQAQNSIPMLMDATTGVIGSVLTGNPAGFFASVAGAVMADYRASYNTPETRGTVATGGVGYVNGFNSFYAVRMRCTSERARIADDFFTMFGYAQNKLMKPNLHARERYTYIKTAGYQCSGIGVPSEYREKIAEIMDNGIRFWEGRHGMAGMYQYDIENTPMGGE